MTEEVKDSYVSFEDWFHEPEGFALRSERFNGDIAWLRAAFDAGRSPTEARGEVKALEWKKVGYTQVAETAACAYTIQPVSDDLGPHWEATVANRGMAWSSRDTESEIKEAVQADYEKRILSALSHPPAREAVDEEMVERAMKAFALIAHKTTPERYEEDKAAAETYPIGRERLQLSRDAIRSALAAALQVKP